MNPGASFSPPHLSLRQSSEEVIPIVELRHLHIGVADFTKGVGVTASASEKTVSVGEALSLSALAKQKNPRVEYLDDVNVGQECLQGLATKCGEPQPVERVRNTHQTTLLLDHACSLLGGKPLGDLLLQEVSDDLSSAGLNLSAHDHGEWGDPFHLQSAGYGIMVSYGNTVDTNVKAAIDDLP